MKLLYKKVLDQLLKTSYLDNNIYLQDGEIIEKLFEKCIFDLSEQEDINRYDTNKEKIKCMINVLKVKDDASYESLKQCLSTEHKHVVKEMLRMEIELQKCKFKWERLVKYIMQQDIVSRKPGFIVIYNCTTYRPRYIIMSAPNKDIDGQRYMLWVFFLSLIVYIATWFLALLIWVELLTITFHNQI